VCLLVPYALDFEKLKIIATNKISCLKTHFNVENTHVREMWQLSFKFEEGNDSAMKPKGEKKFGQEIEIKKPFWIEGEEVGHFISTHIPLTFVLSNHACGTTLCDNVSKFLLLCSLYLFMQ